MHVIDRGPHGSADAADIHCEQALEGGTVGSIIIDGAAGEHPGIIDEDIEPAELLGDFPYQILDLLGIGLVGLEGGGARREKPAGDRGKRVPDRISE
jgi:hypothetical protein